MNIIYNGEKDKAFKEVLGATIPRLCEEDDKVIYLDADLMSCIGTAKWAAAHPDRAIDCGIAEANMIGIAAGLSSVGFKPVVHTFGPFASRRVFDQVFLSGAYAKNSITISGSDPGVCAAYNGGTHMPFEDMALYRAIPDAYVFDITDTAMLEDLLKQCVDIHGIKYIRVGRKNNARMYEPGSKFEIGKGILTKDNGNDATVIAAGIMVDKAMQAADILAEENIEDSFPVPSRYVTNGTSFMLTVKGESMIEAGILDGDYILVQKQNVARNGEIVVALIDDEATVKTFYKESDHIRLQPENSSMDPIIVKDCQILGKVVGVFRKL